MLRQSGAVIEPMESRLLMAGDGLLGEYFDGTRLTDIAYSRVDSTVDFRWFSGGPTGPGKSVGVDDFSIRWSGSVQPAYSQTYTFYVKVDDGARLWIDGKLLIDQWKVQAPTEYRASVALKAGGKHSIKLEYCEASGGAEVHLLWSSTSQAKQVVPKAALYSNPVPPTLPPTTGPKPPIAGDWSMIFSDEFNGTTLNKVWHTAQYWNQNQTIPQDELAAYNASGVSVSGGLLKLKARRESIPGANYVSGMVNTGGISWDPSYPKFSFKFGYMEVRARMTTEQGMFPAIWMMPASYNDANGELDVFEVIGKYPNKGGFFLHRAVTNTHAARSYIAPYDFADAFHTFGVDWREGQITWYVDGIERFHYTNIAGICPEAMYPILSLAVGGDWAGPPRFNDRLVKDNDASRLRAHLAKVIG